jgi:peroxidase
VGAEFQQITYGEYLPATLGPEAMDNYHLTLNDTRTVYNPNMNPTIFNSFATAAYRFGHTLVNGLIIKMLKDQEVGRYNVRDNYFVPDQIINRTTGSMEGYGLILNGLIRQAAQQSDSMFSEDLTNYLFKLGNFIGSDLAARNIQRGRDHGVPGYNEFRKLCGLPGLTTWDELPQQFSQENWDKLRTAYGNGSVDDIDLYTGGLAQDILPGAQTGHTFACLMGKQFERLKYGDRFFFTHANQTGSFNDEQYTNLRKRTFGDIICDNSDLEETGINVFLQASTKVPCNDPSRTSLNISLFIGETTNPNPTGPTEAPGGSTIKMSNPWVVMFISLKVILLAMSRV